MLTRLLTTKELIVLVGVAVAICVGGVAVYLSQPRENLPIDAEKGPEARIGVPDPAPAPMVQPDLEKASDSLDENAPVVEEPQPVTVYVGGAVVDPGMYTLDPGSRVSDLIEAADGLLDYANVSDINMAALLLDGTTLTIPGGERATVEGGRLVIWGARSGTVSNPPQYTISGWSQPRNEPQSREDNAASISSGSGSAQQGGRLDLNRATAAELETLPGIGPKRAQDIINYRRIQPFVTVDDLTNIRGIGPKTLESLRPLVTVVPL